VELITILNRCHRFRGFIYQHAHFSADKKSIEVAVRPRRGSAVCSRCHLPAPGYDQLAERRFEFVPLWGFLVFLLYTMRRVNCRRCGIVAVEEVPWGDGKRTLTKAYMLFLARWARRLSWKETAEAFRTSWDKVFDAVEHVVTFGLEHRVLGQIDAIGVDEIQYAKGHKYLTLVYQIDLDVTRLLWVGRERTIEFFRVFFTVIGDERASKIVFVCSDIWEPYLKVIREKCSEALHILDRFHIVAKMNKALDEIRAGESRRIASEGGVPVLKKSRWLLLKREENLKTEQRFRLRDTSPHTVEVGGRKYKAQTASAVLCCATRACFFQINPTFQRFDCKVFLTDALRYTGGVVERVMIDNTHVVVLRGTGREMVPVPEMEAFAGRFGFRFVAHAIGNANRSARAERPLSFIENNFLAGRTFTSWEDLNQRAREWCDKVNSTYKKYLRGAARTVRSGAPTSQTATGVDSGSVSSASAHGGCGRLRLGELDSLLGASRLDRASGGGARDTGQDRDRNGCAPYRHARACRNPNVAAYHTLAAHRPPRGEGVKRSDPHPEEKAIVETAPETALYVAALKQKGRKVVVLALRQLLRLLREYPREAFLAAVEEAARYGLYDLDRLERMILRRVARDYFLLLDPDTDSHD
jgi:transposase